MAPYPLISFLPQSLPSDLPSYHSLPSVRLFAECIQSGTWQTIILPGAVKKTLRQKNMLDKNYACRVPQKVHSAKSPLRNGKENCDCLIVCQVYLSILGKLTFSQVYFLALGNVFASNGEKIKSHFEAVNYFKFKTFNYKVV
jgi:hypothetical protein